MAPEDAAARWRAIWEARRQRCLDQDELDGVRDTLPAEALAILDEARKLAALDDPAAHAAADVADLVDRLNALDQRFALLLHGVSNDLSMLKLAGEELL